MFRPLGSIVLPFWIKKASLALRRESRLETERKGNPWVDFLMIIMAGGIVRGRVPTTAKATTTTESRNMAAILQIIGW